MSSWILTFCGFLLSVQFQLLSGKVNRKGHDDDGDDSGEDDCDFKKRPCQDQGGESESDDIERPSPFNPPFGFGIAMALLAVLILVKISYWRLRRGHSCRSGSQERRPEPVTPNIVYTLPRQFGNGRSAGFTIPSNERQVTDGLPPPPYSQVATIEVQEKSQQEIELEAPPPYNPETMKF